MASNREKTSGSSSCSCGHTHPPHPSGERKDIPVVEIQGAKLAFNGVPVLRGVDLRIPAGEIVALIGPNGSGKTTLLRAMLGLQKLDAGSVRLFGQPVSGPGLGKVGYVPQRLPLERTFPLTVREFLALRLKETRFWFFQTKKHTTDLILAEIVDIGVEPLLDKPVASLSGGQLQRVLIAFSLLHQPKLLLLDEPTAGVDTPGEQSFYEMITRVQQQRHLTVVLVSHDLSMVYRHASWVYALNGVICCEGTPEQVMNAESLKQAYGIHVSPYHHHHHAH